MRQIFGFVLTIFILINNIICFGSDIQVSLKTAIETAATNNLKAQNRRR